MCFQDLLICTYPLLMPFENNGIMGDIKSKIKTDTRKQTPHFTHTTMKCLQSRSLYRHVCRRDAAVWRQSSRAPMTDKSLLITQSPSRVKIPAKVLKDGSVESPVLQETQFHKSQSMCDQTSWDCGPLRDWNQRGRQLQVWQRALGHLFSTRKANTRPPKQSYCYSRCLLP